MELSARGLVSKIDSEVQCWLVDSANDFRRRRASEPEGPPFPSISGQPYTQFKRSALESSTWSTSQCRTSAR
jgi:hypothetical protein